MDSRRLVLRFNLSRAHMGSLRLALKFNLSRAHSNLSRVLYSNRPRTNTRVPRALTLLNFRFKTV